jgi:Arc/MetJ-type ribon-helix-helix transcriptional regulator
MATKVNIVLDDDVKAELDRAVDPGRRSRVINAALRRELQRMRRESAAAALDLLRAKTRRVATPELVSLIRRDRGR